MSKARLSNINLTPITDNLKQDYLYVDNEIQSSLKRLNFFKHFKRHSNISKRHGYTIESVVFTLIIWAFLKKSSIKTFCEKCIKAFFSGGKDVLYGIMKSEAINWRKISCSTAKEIYKQNNLSIDQESAFVFDDSIKKRSGKKVEGTSLHFEHAEGRNVIGHQMLELGLSFKNGFLPLDRQIYIGNKKRHLLNEEFKSKKCAVAKDFECASEKNKNEMFREMLTRAIRHGFKAVYCLADSWFNSKENIKAVRDKNIVGIFRAKRSKLKYRFNGKDYCLTELYFLLKRRFKKQKGCNWKTVGIVVQLNVAEDKKKEEWVDVKLVFSAPKNQKKNQWAAFLSTDSKLKESEVLRIYAMRWAIEVYFKEIKQNMGFLKEQSPSYASHYASIHLTAIRYILLLDMLLTQGEGTFGKLRKTVTGKIEMLTFASMLWELFKAIIYGALDSFKEIVGVKILTEIKSKISCTVEELLAKALQLDEDYIATEIKAEQLEVLL